MYAIAARVSFTPSSKGIVFLLTGEIIIPNKLLDSRISLRLWRKFVATVKFENILFNHQLQIVSE